jgi:hypothetical protein
MTVRRSIPRRAALLWALVVSATALLLATIRVYALPPVTEQTELWYSYQASLSLDWTAKVKPGHYYPQPNISPDALVQQRLPVEPPQFRRVLLAPLAESIIIRIPYRFQGDRPAPLQFSFGVEQALLMPGYWQQVRQIVPVKTWETQEASLSGEATVEVPLGQLQAELERARTDLGFVVEPLELEIRPRWEVRSTGLREPVVYTAAPVLRISYRGNSVEVDEPKQQADQKALTYKRQISNQVSLWGAPLSVRTAQWTILTLFLITAGGLLFLLGRRLTRNRTALTEQLWLKRLQPFLVHAETFKVHPDVTIVQVASLREMARLQQQSTQPLIQVGGHLYLKDGGTCFLCAIPDGGRKTEATAPVAAVAAAAETGHGSEAPPNQPAE